MNPVTIGMRSSRGRTTAAALLGTASVLALGTTPAFGQASTITITGSIIAGAQAVGVPVTAVGEEQFIEQGAVTTADMLYSVPSVDVDASLTSLRGGGTTGYGQDVAIHGFHGSGGDVITLMLIDNQRWPIQGHGGDTVDPSIIPQLALDRVDVLTAGASATYGADAIVGVINVILKRNFEGARSNVTVATPVEIGQGWKISASHIHGVSWDTGNVTVTAEAYFYQRMRAAALGRDKYTTNFSDLLGYDVTPIAMSMPGVISIGPPHAPAGTPDGFEPILGTRYCDNCYALPHGIGWEYGTQDPGPTTTWSAIEANKFVVGQRNEENQRINYDDSWALPQQTREAVVATLDQRLTPDLFGLGQVQFLGTMFYSNRKGQMHFGVNTNSGNSREHASFRRADTGVLVPANNPYIPTGLEDVADAGMLRMNINATPLLGSTSRINFENVATRYKGAISMPDLPWGWAADAYYSMSNEENHTHTTAMINRDRAARALGSNVKGDTKPSDVPYLNVFCDALTWGTACNSQKTLDYITGFRFQDNQWRIRQMGINFSGPIFELPSGQVNAAVGAEHLSQHYWFSDWSNAGTADPDHPSGDIEYDIAKRISHAFLAQINIPVLGGQWSIPGLVEGFDVQVGYRLDKFDFKKDYVKTPKVAGTLTLGYGLTLRGAWGKSFRAPGFGQTSAASGSRAIGTNILGGAGSNDFLFDCNNSFDPASAGTALAGSATQAFNPTCSTDPSLQAPALIELAGGSGLGDYARGLSQSLRPGGPGKGLDPETSKQYNLGFNFAPTDGILAGLNLDVSYFDIKIEGTIRGDTSGQQDPDNPLARHLFILRPSKVSPGADDSAFDAIIANLAALPGSTSTFDRGRTYDAIMDGANANLGFIEYKGIDYSFRYDWDMGNWGSFNIGNTGYYELNQEAQSGPGSPVESVYDGSVDPVTGERTGRNSGARFQRMRSRIGWTSPDATWSTTLFATSRFHEGPNTNILLPECFWADGYSAGDCYAGSPYYPQEHNQFYNTSPGWTQFDLNITYNTRDMPANEYLRNITASLTINNVLDADPPQVFNSRSRAREIFAFDSRFAEYGRFVSLSITKDW